MHLYNEIALKILLPRVGQDDDTTTTRPLYRTKCRCVAAAAGVDYNVEMYISVARNE